MIDLSSLYIVIHFIPVVTMLLCSIFTFTIRGNKRPTAFLAWGRLMIAVLLAVNAFQMSNTPEHYRTLWNPVLLFAMMMSHPLFFAYMLNLLNPKYPDRKFWIFTYGLSVFTFLLMLAMGLIYGHPGLLTNYDMVFAEMDKPEMWVRFACFFIIIFQVTLIAYACIVELKKHKENLLSEFSYTEGINLNWVYFIIGLCSLFTVSVLLTIALSHQMFKFISLIILTIEAVITTSLMLKQKDIYSSENDENIDSVEEKNSYDSFIQQTNHKANLKNRLLDLLDKEEVFKDPELNSEKVCRILGTNRTYLSQTINQELNTNFYNMVNSYRLNKAIELMKSPLQENMSLKTTAILCGFKTPSAFATFFKEQKGCSPSEWKKNNM